MAKTQKIDGMNAKEMAVVGAGLAAIAAGAYFFFGPEGKKHQKKMKGWMVRMKGEVLEKIEDAKEMSETTYSEIVDAAAKAQELSGRIPKAEILALAQELKRQWKTIKRNAGSTQTKAKRIASKSRKTAR